MKYAWIVLALIVVNSAFAEWPKKVAKPNHLSGVPGHYDYRTPGDRSPTLTVQGSPALPMQEVSSLPGVAEVPVANGPKLRYFQLPVRGLAIDHCSITRVVVTIRNDGTYIVSFRADQHPQLAGSIGDPALSDETALRPLRIRETAHLKRNEFTVKFRLLGTPLRKTLPPAGLGRPVLVNLPLDPFWVQRGEPKNVFVSKRLQEVKDYFELIEGIEVDLSYR